MAMADLADLAEQPFRRGVVRRYHSSHDGCGAGERSITTFVEHRPLCRAMFDYHLGSNNGLFAGECSNDHLVSSPDKSASPAFGAAPFELGGSYRAPVPNSTVLTVLNNTKRSRSSERCLM